MTTLADRYTLNAKVRNTEGAEVYRGYRATDGTPVLVKLLRSDHPTSLEVGRLRNEYEILTWLDIPEVVRAIGLERHGHGLALVMEDAGDVSVDRLIRSGYLDLGRSLELALSMARVLAAVHRKRVIHRDIKPHHFFVKDSDGSLVLVDFGAATRLSQKVDALSAATRPEGTLAYIAPEQTGRMNRRVDARSDLYSLGVTLYELFTGVLPFDTSDPLELVHSHIARAPRAPTTHRPDLPPVVSEIILKLLSKTAEQRYQTASGLQHDLQRCLDQVKRSGVAEVFQLARRDRSDELSIPEKLYGRERALAELLESFGRARQGGNELVLLSGQAGVGKSALVEELHRQVLGAAYFGAGKFDYLARSVPYGPIAHACRALVRSVLAEPPGVLEQRRHAILEAVGPNAGLLIDMVPELGLVVGPQPAVPALGPSESQRRFERVFLSFLGALATPERPLVLFMDDLQWADGSSLRLLQHALTAADARHMLVVGAYRELEVDAAHPLRLMLQELRQSEVKKHEIALGPLGLPHIAQLLGETLGCAPDAVRELSAVLLEKTRGNPFFLGQFLTALHRDGLLRFDQQDLDWRWDAAAVWERLATDNVIDFMLDELRRLPQASQDMLHLAACVGHSFDMGTLAIVSQRSPGDVANHLWEALRQGFIVSLDGQHRHRAAGDRDPVEAVDAALDAAYRFQHDRVQQAAYSLISPEEQGALHLRIGRLLLERSGAGPSDRELFTIADHLGRGASLIVDPAERRALARLNLSAGRKARAAAAPDAANHYLRAALDLLGEAGWSEEHDVICAAHLIMAECEYLTGNLDSAFALLQAVERNARSVQDRIKGRNLEVLLLTSTGKLDVACMKVVDALRLLDLELPPLADRAALGAAIGAEFGAYQAAIAGSAVESLGAVSEMSDARELALLDTLANGIPAAFQFLTELHVLLVLKGVQLLRRGTAGLAGFFYEQYAIVHLIITGDREHAFRFGRLGVELATRGGSPASRGQVHFLFGGFIAHWRQHISHSLEALRSGLRLCLEMGDQIYASYCASFVLHCRIYAGESLHDLDDSLVTARDLAERTGDVINQAFCKLGQQIIRALTGQTRHPASLESADFEEDAFMAAAPQPALTMFWVAKLIVQYFAGHFREVLVTSDGCNPIAGFFHHGEQIFYRALSLAELTRAAAPEERAGLLARLRADAATLEAWAQSSPENHAHRAALVQAEIARIERRAESALDLYDRAIALAEEHGFVHAEAIGNELAGRFHLDQGRSKVANAYLAEAIYGYQRWGATCKVEALKSRYAHVLRSSEALLSILEPASAKRASFHPAPIQTSSAARSGESLDLAAAIRATEAISTELVVDRLLERLMRTLLESAGAQRGCLILDRAGVLALAASMTIDPDTMNLGTHALQGSSEVPESLVRYVARTRELTILTDAHRDVRFAADRYFTRAQPRSVLCAPMLQGGKVAGVLYLENTIAAEAFSPARCGLVQFLATQAAVSLENAMLYGRLDAASQELRRANENLEALVAERTAELRRLLAELWSEMDLARKIQTVLLPQQTRVKDYEMAAVMTPADSVGGDYYDVVQTDGSSWVLIGDVSGHGVTAGLIMMMVQTAVRTILTTSQRDIEPLTPAAVLSRANRAVRENLLRIGPDQYMTIVALELGRGTVRHAGLHLDIVIHRAASNTVELVATQGMWIGIEDDITALLEDDVIHLDVGDTILLYTDGITESVTSEGGMLETRGLAERFHALAAQRMSPAAIVKGIVGPMAGQQLRDDVTVMVIRYSPASSLMSEPAQPVDGWSRPL
ncbi:AAA family ATPase [Sorangium sp. So ce1099]|uniref:AAA family ATPase n=1 Tax=Sorangium sp. So ce1099 TaxID=3133331 RepID=UPI003F63520E